MASLYQRLEAALGGVVPPERRVELLAEQGCYAAREGSFELARARVASLRAYFLDAEYAPALNWVMLIEGLIQYFEVLGVSAQDRVRRAYVCSKALGLPKLNQQSAAWLAHLEFERTNVPEVMRLVLEHDPRVVTIDSTARLRFAMVLADAYMYVGERSKAQRWFEVARGIAVDLGDQVSLGALMYNRAVFGLASIRAQAALGNSAPVELYLKLAAQELASAKAFESAVQVTALRHLVQVGEARIAMLRGDFAVALELFRAASSRIEDFEDRPNKTHTLADVGRCLWHIGQRGEALDVYRRFLSLEDGSIDLDDRLVGAQGAIDVLEAAGEAELLARAQSLYERSAAEYLTEVHGISSSLARLELQAPSAQVGLLEAAPGSLPHTQ